MTFFRPSLVIAAITVLTISGSPTHAAPFVFSTGSATNSVAMGSRPSADGQTEIEAADDFFLSDPTRITSASFTGLLQSAAGAAPNVNSVAVEIYRVFPLDSNIARALNVPTRMNSPSDVAFDSRASGAAELSFTTAVLTSSFAALNSVLAGGINPSPNQTTGGDGPVVGQQIRFDVSLASDLLLPAGHYFFVPQVGVSGGDFLWLSAARPIVAPGTPLPQDLQAWIRDAALAPDWLRVGTDIVGGNPAPTFNGAFSLAGETQAAVPEPASAALALAALAIGAGLRSRQRRSRRR